MNKVNIAILQLLLVIMLYSCKSATRNDTSTQIFETSKKMLKSISDSNYHDFKKLMYKRNIDEEYLVYYFQLSHYCVKKFNSNIDSIPIIISNEKQIDSTIKVIIPLYSGFDSSTGLLNAEIQIFFGPKQFVKFDRITNFVFNVKNDANYRKGLFRSGQIKSNISIDTNNYTFDEVFDEKIK